MIDLLHSPADDFHRALALTAAQERMSDLADRVTLVSGDMPAHAELRVIERLLPESGGDSLAVPWDIHMLCNTGGRERTESHYRALLADAGFEWVDTHPSPLDAHLVRARRR